MPYGVPTEVTMPISTVLAALRKHSGVITPTAKEVGLDRATLSKFIDRTPELKREMAIQREQYVEKRMDVAENVLDQLMQKVDSRPELALRSSIYILNNHGRRRNYNHPEVIAAENSKPVMIVDYNKVKEIVKARKESKFDIHTGSTKQIPSQ